MCFGCLLEFCLSGCALVEKVEPDGSVTRSFVAGAPAILIEPDSASRPKAIKVTGLGFGASGATAMLGYYKLTEVSLDESCRLVIMPETDMQTEAFSRMISKLGPLCKP